MQNKWFCLRVTSEGEAVLFSTLLVPFWLCTSICKMKLLICLNLLLKQLTIKSISSQHTASVSLLIFDYYSRLESNAISHFPPGVYLCASAGGGLDRRHRVLRLSVCPYVHPGYFCARNISITLQGMFFKFCTNVDSDSMMNWRDFGGRRSLQPRVLWTQQLSNAWRELLHSWFMGPLGLMDELITFWRSRVKVAVTLRVVKAVFQEHLEGVSSNLAHMSTLPQWSLDVKCQTQKLKSLRTIFQECTEGFFSNLVQTYTWTEGWTD